MASPYPFNGYFGTITVDDSNPLYCNSGTAFSSELADAKKRIADLESGSKSLLEHHDRLLRERNKLLVTVEKQAVQIAEQEQQKVRVVTERDHLFGVVHEQAKTIVSLNQQVTSYQKGNETVLEESRKVGNDNHVLRFKVHTYKKTAEEQAATIKAGQDAARFARLLLEGFLVRAGSISSSISGDLNHALFLLTKVIGDK